MTKKKLKVYCRFTDKDNKNITDVITMKRVDDNYQICTAPKIENTGDTNVEVSVNK
jgi:hypothetical protein